MQEFGDLVLVIGDFHVPHRAADMPKCFIDLLETDRISHVLCTGNVGCQPILDRLHKVAPNVHIVKGDADFDFEFPEYKVLNIGDFKIGLIHGHQALPWGSVEGLADWQRRLDCDILVSGNTHTNSAEQVEGKYFVNPGSATGAWQPHTATLKPPSFMLMAIHGSDAMLYVYEERDKKPNVVMSEFSKNPGRVTSTSGAT